ncbi:MAG TPA: nucleotidyltransferase family protein [bacterium]
MWPANDLLTPALRAPERIAALTLHDWDLLIRQARRANLLGRLRSALDDAGLLASCPARPRDHLDAAWIVAEKHAADVRWEIDRIEYALSGIGHPALVLKGGAYVLAELPTARGRIFGDVDIMVPKGRLEEVEKILFGHGWMTTHHNAYDQRYYRQWMHELPPLRHMRRRTVLDVHHAILPETARIHPEPARLWAAAVAIAGHPGLKVLAPVDMVLHGAAHLFHDGELEHGLRDLVDLDGLLRYFGGDEAFWSRLVPRAVELGLTRPLYYALRYTTTILATPVPGPVMADATVGRPGALLAPIMDALFSRALAPDHPSCTSRLTAVARWLLYIRAHYLRMPLHLLIPHLVRKAIGNRRMRRTRPDRLTARNP